MKTLDMTQGRPLGLVLRFAIPLFIGTLFQQVYNLTDTMIVGYGLGENAVAAVGATASLYSVLINFASGLNSGCGIVIARAFGGKEQEKLRQAFAGMVFLDLAVTLLLTAASLLFLQPLLRWLDTPADIFQQSYQYIRIILAGMATTILYNMAAGFLRAVGNSRTPLYFLILSCGLNVGLDLLFVIVLDSGVAGAALATVIAQGVSAVLCLCLIARNYREFLPRRDEWRLQPQMMGEMFSTGLSMGLMLSVFSIGSIFLQRAINALSTSVITAHTASRRIYELLMMPLSTLATANATFVGQNFGAGKLERIASALRQVIGLALAWSVVSAVAAYGTGESLVRILIGTSDPAVIGNAVLNLRVCTLFFFPLGVLLILRSAMQPMGHKVSPVLSSGIELAGKVLSAAVVIPRLGYLGVVMTEPVIWVVCALYLGCIYLKSLRRQSKIEKMTGRL